MNDDIENIPVQETDDGTDTRRVPRGRGNHSGDYQVPPEIGSIKDAIAFAEAIVARIAPFPEVVTVLAREDFGGALAPRGSSGYTLGDGAEAKMQHIASRVKDEIRFRAAGPRMPDLMLASSSGAVAFLWTCGIFQVA